MHRFKLLFAGAAACAALLGCGGGDSASSAATTNDATAVAGLWSGSTSTGRQAFAVVLSTGQYWALYTTAVNHSLIAGVAEGNATINGNSISSTNGLDFNLEGLGVSQASLTGIYASKNFLNGTVHYPNSNVSISASYVAAPPANLSQVTGSFRGSAAVIGGAETTNLAIALSGTITGSSASGCHFTGTAAARADAPVFDVTVTFGGAPCALGTSTVAGVAFYDLESNRLYSAALNSGRTNGFLFAGGRV